MENGFPTLTDSFLAGQDIFYTQFNEIEFYVEDEGQEHFYFNVLNKLFPNMIFDKIFPLNGKRNVINTALTTVGNKKKVYIVDLDFDHVLGKKENLENLFYLEKYSIENHLLCKNAIFEIIREKESKLKNDAIESVCNYEKLLKVSCYCLAKLATVFILIQKHSLGNPYFGVNPARDFDFTVSKPIFKNNFITQYFSDIESALRLVDGRYTLDGQIKRLKNNFNTLDKALANIPGKYLLNIVKYRLEANSLIHPNLSLDSFIYKLSKEVDINELRYLQANISAYIS